MQSSFWIRDLDLRDDDKVILEDGCDLNDRHMLAAHKILAKMFPSLEGLQSTLLAQNGSFRPVFSLGGYLPDGKHDNIYCM